MCPVLSRSLRLQEQQCRCWRPAPQCHLFICTCSVPQIWTYLCLFLLQGTPLLLLLPTLLSLSFLCLWRWLFCLKLHFVTSEAGPRDTPISSTLVGFKFRLSVSEEASPRLQQKTYRECETHERSGGEIGSMKRSQSASRRQEGASACLWRKWEGWGVSWWWRRGEGGAS